MSPYVRPGGEPLRVERPLETLHRTAGQLGAVVCLTSSADQRAVLSQRKPFTRDEGSALRLLAVVKPSPSDRHDGRWERLARGVTLCSAELIPEITVDDAASVLLDELQAAINEWRQRHAA